MVAFINNNAVSAFPDEVAAVWRSSVILLAGAPANVDELAAELSQVTVAPSASLLVVRLPMDCNWAHNSIDADTLVFDDVSFVHALHDELTSLADATCGCAVTV